MLIKTIVYILFSSLSIFHAYQLGHMIGEDKGRKDMQKKYTGE